MACCDISSGTKNDNKKKPARCDMLAFLFVSFYEARLGNKRRFVCVNHNNYPPYP